jgi:hypothetical protein
MAEKEEVKKPVKKGSSKKKVKVKEEAVHVPAGYEKVPSIVKFR